MAHFDTIPEEIKQFILSKIDSVPHLEALLLIWEHRMKTWTDDELARALFVDLRVARKIANDLLRRGWITQQQGMQDGFVYDGSWDAENRLMGQLADTYRTNIVRVATLIHSNTSAVREFAKAFDLKKE